MGGTGLPSTAECQAKLLQPNHRLRRQASSHSYIAMQRMAPMPLICLQATFHDHGDRAYDGG